MQETDEGSIISFSLKELLKLEEFQSHNSNMFAFLPKYTVKRRRIGRYLGGEEAELCDPEV